MRWQCSLVSLPSELAVPVQQHQQAHEPASTHACNTRAPLSAACAARAEPGSCTSSGEIDDLGKYMEMATEAVTDAVEQVMLQILPHLRVPLDRCHYSRRPAGREPPHGAALAERRPLRTCASATWAACGTSPTWS
jgi:hypothetical protein